MEQFIEKLKAAIMAESYEDVTKNMAWRSVISTKRVLEVIDRLAAEQPKDGNWIYCSERMPTSDEYIQNDGRFIVTDGMRVYQRHFEPYKYNMFIEPMVSNTFNDLLDYSVIAWQPLPEKPEQEE